MLRGIFSMTNLAIQRTGMTDNSAAAIRSQSVLHSGAAPTWVTLNVISTSVFQTSDMANSSLAVSDLRPNIPIFSGTPVEFSLPQPRQALHTANRHLRDLREALSLEPVRDGYHHPAAKILESYFVADPDAARSLAALPEYADVEPTFVADTIRLLTHFTPSTRKWRADLVAGALGSSSLAVRDAAIQAIEIWEEPQLIVVLARHEEPDPWLSAYQATLLAQLRA